MLVGNRLGGRFRAGDPGIVHKDIDMPELAFERAGDVRNLGGFKDWLAAGGAVESV